MPNGKSHSFNPSLAMLWELDAAGDDDSYKSNIGAFFLRSDEEVADVPPTVAEMADPFWVTATLPAPSLRF